MFVSFYFPHLQLLRGELLVSQSYWKLSRCRFDQMILPSARMKGVIYLLFDLLTTLAKLLPTCGNPTVIVENLHLKQQLILWLAIDTLIISGAGTGRWQPTTSNWML